MQKKLFTDSLLDFVLLNSCGSQVMSIKLDICECFDCNLPVDLRGIITYIFQALITSGMMV